MQFDGEIHHVILGPKTAWGTVTRFVPSDGFPVEIHLAHAYLKKGFDAPYKGKFKRGDITPLVPGDMGLTLGVHTHTEGVAKFTDEDLSDMRMTGGDIIIQDSEPNLLHLRAHCKKYKLDEKSFLRAIDKQIAEWGITELGEHYAVRQFLGAGRNTSWRTGQGFILFDTMHYLKI
jgi:hypothetical protein